MIAENTSPVDRLDERLKDIYEQIEQKRQHKEDTAITYWKGKIGELGIGNLSIPWSEYIPVVPTPKQLAFLLLNDYEEVMYGGATGGGKVVMENGVVLTPFGFRKIQDLKVGDAVNNPDGSVCKIIQLHPWRKHEVWRVRFHDGSYTDVAKDHLWLAWRSGKTKKKSSIKQTGEESAQVVETQELANWLTSAKKSKRKTWPLIPICQPQRFNVTLKKRCNLDPYQLGTWIGDGHSSKQSSSSYMIGITSADKEHFEREFIGSSYSNRKYLFSFTKDTRKEWEDGLTKIGLIGLKAPDKFIPREYKLGSLETRLAILQGLMDTDGTVDARGQVYFTSTSKQLAEDVQFIVQSLGGTATLFQKKEPFYRNSDNEKVICKTAYTLYIKHRDESSLFRLQRKKDRCRPEGNLYRRVVKIEVLKERRRGRCITVSHPNGLYLTNDFIVTHNSFVLLMGALQYVDRSGYNALVLRRSLTASAQAGSVMDIGHQWLKGIVQWESKTNTYRFPSGAGLTFGYADSLQDVINQYQGSNFQFIGWDELTQYPATCVDDDGEEVCEWYLYMFSRLRKSVENDDIPLRVRSTANPGGIGHNWVKNRFKLQYDEKAKLFRGFNPQRPMVPSFCWDNKHLDIKSYIKSLMFLDPNTRNQLLMGDWNAAVNGRIKAEWFRTRRYSTRGPYLFLDPEGRTKPYEVSSLRFFLTVDPAASSREGPGDAQIFRNKEPSSTVIATWFVVNNVLGLWNIRRFQKEIPEVCKEIHDVYKELLKDPRSIRPEFIGIEWNGINKGVYQTCERMGLPTRPLDPGSQDKMVRSTDFQNRSERGLVYLPYHADVQAGTWLGKYENELYTWTGHPGQSADQIDVSSYAAIIVSTEFSHSEISETQSFLPHYETGNYVNFGREGMVNG